TNSTMFFIYPEKETHPSEFVVERTPKEFTFVPPEERAAVYFIAVASNATKPIGGHVSFLVDISNDLVRHRDGIIGKVTAERDNLQARASALEDQNASFQSTIQAYQRLLAQRQEQISKLNEFVKQKDKRLSDLHQTLTETQNNYARDVAW